MAKIPNAEEPLGIKIVKEIDKNIHMRIHRPHMGYSEAGDNCKRKTWYAFHWAYAEEIDARIMRIFETGNIAEEFMTASLDKAHIKVFDQQKEIISHYGHVRGHIDGTVYSLNLLGNDKMLLEMKTANDKNFREITKKGVKGAKKDHYHQMQAYMGKLNILNALYMCYNKNDSTYYIEIVPFNRTIFENIERTFFDILTSPGPVDKLVDAVVTWHECKWCPAFDICLKGKQVERNCRTCQFVTIENDGIWRCTKYDKKLSVQEQRDGCDFYILEQLLENEDGL